MAGRGFKDLPPQLKERQHDRRYDRLGVKIPLSESLEDDAPTTPPILARPYCAFV